MSKSELTRMGELVSYESRLRDDEFQPPSKPLSKERMPMRMRLEWFRNTSYTSFSRRLDVSAIGDVEYETPGFLLLSKIGIEWGG